MKDEQTKRKILNAAVLAFSLVGYLEWGGGQQAFLFEMEWQVLSKLFSEPLGAIHPFTVIPLIGQGLLLITIFQKKPKYLLTYLGIGSLAVLLLFMLLAGIMGGNIKTIFSLMPFLFFAGWSIKNERSMSKYS